MIGSGRHEPDGDWDRRRSARGLVRRLSFVDVLSADDGADLAAAVREAREELGEDARVLLYLSVPPSAMRPWSACSARGARRRARW